MVSRTQRAAPRPRTIAGGFAILMALLGCGAARAGTVQREAWGRTADGQALDLYTITEGKAKLSVTNYGARMVSLDVPDRAGRPANVLVSRKRPEEFTGLMAVAGATIGRYANRIAGGRFRLDGVEHSLSINNNGNTLHGGASGFNTRVWSARAVRDGVEMRLISPDGDMGFPGRAEVTVTYTLTRTRQGAQVQIAYAASTSKPTVINLTNHAFFHLGGDGGESVRSHVATIAADRYTPTEPNGIPTGRTVAVADTPLDFRAARPFGQNIPARGFDTNLVLRRPGLNRLQARVTDPSSGRSMSVYTTEPAIQLFLLNSAAITDDRDRAATPAGFCLETQHFPDSPNQPSFPSTMLSPGQRWTSVTRYVFAAR